MAKEFQTARINGLKLADVDISGFDWSVQGWELEMDAEARIALALEPSPLWVNAVRNRVRCLSLSVFAFSDGEMVAQDEPGIQKSGSYNTSSTNSRISVMLSWYLGVKYVAAAGDDVVAEHIPNAPQLYAELGHTVKQYGLCPDVIEFCSSKISPDGSWEPTTWSKTFYRFLSQPDSRMDYSLWYQFRYVLRTCPHLWRMVSWLERLPSGSGVGDKINGWRKQEEEWRALERQEEEQRQS
jgi:hypothetical protein